MTPPARSGRIEIITGPMFSGKGEELIRRAHTALAAGRTVHSYTALAVAVSDQSPHQIRHNGTVVETRAIHRAEDILRYSGNLAQVDVITVDDAQFFGAGLVEVSTHLAESGVRLIVAGTDTDFRGEPFGVMGHLLLIAEELSKLSAICSNCGRPACRTQRLIDGRHANWEMPVIMLGGDRYQARCRSCFAVPKRDEHQVNLL